MTRQIPTGDAIWYLENQHRGLKRLFSRLERAMESTQRIELFKEVADMLAIHVTVEEHHFYPAVNERRTEELLVEALEEHLGIKRMLADMLEVGTTDSAFPSKLKILKEQVERHAEEEEGDLFPKVRKLFAPRELVAIAKNMRDEQGALEGTSPRNRMQFETAERTLLR